MGYAVTSVSSEGVKNALTDHVTFVSGLCYQMTGTVEEVFYKKTHDLTDVDYIELTGLVAHTANVGTLTLYFDTTSKGTAAVNAGSLYDKDSIINITVDCTAITGDQIIKLGLVNGNAGGTSYVSEICIYARET